MNSINTTNAKQHSEVDTVIANQKTVVIMAGGTGGHVFPALAVAKELEKSNTRIVWLGTKKGIESKLVPNAGYDIHYLKVAGLVGTGIKRKLTAPFMLVFAMLQALKVMMKEKPDCVLGMGGFASGPGGVAAKILGKKIVIHEQNAFAGLTNQKLSKIADSVLTGFRSCEGLPETSIWVGNPVRKEIEIKARNQSLNQSQDVINILVLGGSQGAKSLNDFLPSCLGEVAKNISVRIWHQAGTNKSTNVNESYQKFKEFKTVLVEEFINDMATAYAWADIVICRAGAMTIAELTAAGKPSVLVPFPYAAGDHQTKNAKSMVKAEAAILIADAQINSPAFSGQLVKLLNSPEKLKQMSANAADLYRPTAAKQVADFCRVYINA